MKFISKMKKIILIGFFFLTNLYIIKGQGLTVDKIIGIVGDKIILFSDLEIQYRQYLSQGLEGNEDLKCKMLDQMFKEKMLLTQSIIDSIKVTDEEIENELERRLRYFISMIGSKTKLEEYYQKSTVEIKEEFREDVENQLLGNKMKSDIIKNAKITPSEIKAFFNKIPKDSIPSFNAEMEVGQIVRYPKVNKLQDDLAIEKISKLRNRILDGEDFSTLAILYSEDLGSAQNGGELGFMERGDLVPEFQESAFQLKAGDISDVVKTEFGYHIIQMIERRGEKINARHILVKASITTSELNEAKLFLDTIRNLITNDSIIFSAAVNLYSDDVTTKNNGGILMNQQTGSTFFEPDQLDASVYFTIEKLKPGEVSGPVLFKTSDDKEAYRLLYLKSETKPHKANLHDDYNKIQSAALNEKQNNILSRWFIDKTAKTYIQIDEEYRQCEAMKQWLKPDMNN